MAWVKRIAARWQACGPGPRGGLFAQAWVLAATLAAVAALAAPVVGDGGTAAALAPATAAQGDGPADGWPSSTAAALPSTTVRSLDRSLAPDTSTGNRHYDLLLELQGQPDAQARRVAPVSAAAASAAAAELAALRARAAQAPQAPEDALAAPAGPGAVDRKPRARPGLSLQPFDGMGLQQIEQRAAEQVPRRYWSGPYDGGGGAERADPSGGYADDNMLRAILRQAAQYLRDNGFWLLALCGLIGLLAAALKAYSRRV